MEPGGIVAGAQIERLPCVGVQVVDGVVLLAGKAEEPVARSKGGDVRLIHLADGEGAGNAFMAALHSRSVLRIKRTALLVDHNTVFTQCVVADTVKFACKISL